MSWLMGISVAVAVGVVQDRFEFQVGAGEA